MNDQKLTQQEERATTQWHLFLLPVKITAYVHLGKSMYRKGTITHLSSEALYCNLQFSGILPDTIEIYFKTSKFSRMLDTTVAVTKIEEHPDGLTVAGKFHDIPEDDRRYIETYIDSWVNLNAPRLFLNNASFLLILDSLWRICFFLLYRFYALAPTEATIPKLTPATWQGVVISVYLFCGLSTFLITEKPSDIRKNNFLHALWFLSPACAFLIIKVGFHLIVKLWASPYTFIKSMFGFEAFLTLFIGGALSYGIFHFKKAKAVIQGLDEHIREMRTRLETASSSDENKRGTKKEPTPKKLAIDVSSYNLDEPDAEGKKPPPPIQRRTVSTDTPTKDTDPDKEKKSPPPFQRRTLSVDITDEPPAQE